MASFCVAPLVRRRRTHRGNALASSRRDHTGAWPETQNQHGGRYARSVPRFRWSSDPAFVLQIRGTRATFGHGSWGEIFRTAAGSRIGPGGSFMAVPFDQMQGLIWYDGKLVPGPDAKIHVLTHGLHYASAV